MEAGACIPHRGSNTTNNGNPSFSAAYDDHQAAKD
jgi:hypothetical protein